MNGKINALHEELQRERLHVGKLKAAIGLRASSNLTTTELFAQISRDTKNANMESKLAEKRKIIEMQKHEILLLQRTVCELQRAK